MKKLFFVIICLFLAISLVWGKTWTSSIVSKSYEANSGYYYTIDDMEFNIPPEIDQMI